jgi:hypothetical protein
MSAIGTDRLYRPVPNYFRCLRLTGCAAAVPVLHMRPRRVLKWRWWPPVTAGQGAPAPYQSGTPVAGNERRRAFRKMAKASSRKIAPEKNPMNPSIPDTIVPPSPEPIFTPVSAE